MNGSEPLSVQVESRNSVARVAVAGELDLATTPILSEHLTRLDGDGLTGIIVDLRGVSFVDSTGLHVFLDAWNYAETNGHRFVLVGAQPHVRRLFEVTQTEHLLDEHEVVSVLHRFTEDGDRSSESDSEAGPSA